MCVCVVFVFLEKRCISLMFGHIFRIIFLHSWNRAQFEDMFVGPFAEAKKFCGDKESYLKQVKLGPVSPSLQRSVLDNEKTAIGCQFHYEVLVYFFILVLYTRPFLP